MKSLRKWLLAASVLSVMTLAGCVVNDNDDDNENDEDVEVTVEGEGERNDEEAEGEARGSPSVGLLAALAGLVGTLIFLGRRKA